MQNWNEMLDIYDQLIKLCPDFERKGKTVPYTSANGYMFSQLNKDAQIGIRLPKADCAKFKLDYNTTEFRSYGAVMRDYVLIPDTMLDDLGELSRYLNDGFKHVMSLPPK